MDALSEDDLLNGLSVWHLQFFGIWSNLEHYRLTGKWNWIIKVKFVVGTFLMVSSILCQIAACFVVKLDLQKMVFLSTQVTACLHVYIRTMVLWFQLGHYTSILKLLRKDFLESIPDAERSENERIYRSVAVPINIFVKGIIASAVFVCVLWCCFPSYSIESILRRTGDMSTRPGDKVKVLGGWYPGPMETSPYYEIVYVYEVAMSIWVCCLAPVYLCANMQPLICISTHSTVLGRYISSLKVGEDATENGKENSEMYKQLYAALQDHQKLINEFNTCLFMILFYCYHEDLFQLSCTRYSNELIRTYNYMVTVTLGLAIYMQTVCLFQALFGSTRDPLFVLKFLQTVTYAICEVGMFCYGSSYLEDASSGLGLAVFSSEWYRADTKFKKMAQMLMVGSRKGITFTAVRMYPVTLVTMLEMFQMVYSAAALVTRMAR